MNKYYFIFYKCQRWGWRKCGKDSNWISTGSHVTENQSLSDVHPLQFQLDCNEKYNKEIQDNDCYKHREEYTVVSWQELTKEEYEQFDGYIG
jgi:hypothetical protein